METGINMFVKIMTIGTSENYKGETSVVEMDSYINLSRVNYVISFGSVARLVFSSRAGDYIEVKLTEWERVNQ
jgi:hypothetical protein